MLAIMSNFIINATLEKAGVFDPRPLLFKASNVELGLSAFRYLYFLFSFTGSLDKHEQRPTPLIIVAETMKFDNYSVMSWGEFVRLITVVLRARTLSNFV